jgi:putative phosphoribosyl transferase
VGAVHLQRHLRTHVAPANASEGATQTTMIELPYKNRVDAGRCLARSLLAFADRPDVVVLGLPRGGVVVAFEVAQALRAPLDVMVVRKLGVPGQEEFALGAVSTGGVRVLDHRLIATLGVPSEIIEALTCKERAEVERRERLYRGYRPPLKVAGQVVILVDDGVATGSTTRAALSALRQQTPARIIVAVPVAPASVCKELRDEVDCVVCLAQPEKFFAVGQWYWNFSQTTDDEVRELLRRASSAAARSAA